MSSRAAYFRAFNPNDARESFPGLPGRKAASPYRLSLVGNGVCSRNGGRLPRLSVEPQECTEYALTLLRPLPREALETAETGLERELEAAECGRVTQPSAADGRSRLFLCFATWKLVSEQRGASGGPL